MWGKRSTYLFLPLAPIVAVWAAFATQGESVGGVFPLTTISIGLGWMLLALAIILSAHRNISIIFL